MKKALEFIYEGLIYTYTIGLVAVAMYLLLTAATEASYTNYGNSLLTIAASGLTFSIVTLTSRYLQE